MKSRGVGCGKADILQNMFVDADPTIRCISTFQSHNALLCQIMCSTETETLYQDTENHSQWQCYWFGARTGMSINQHNHSSSWRATHYHIKETPTCYSVKHEPYLFTPLASAPVYKSNDAHRSDELLPHLFSTTFIFCQAMARRGTVKSAKFHCIVICHGFITHSSCSYTTLLHGCQDRYCIKALQDY